MVGLWESILAKDSELFLWLNQSLNQLDVPFIRALLRFANQFGAEMTPAVVAIAVIVLSNSHRSRIRRLLDLGCSLAVTALFVQMFKASFARYRPQHVWQDDMDQIHVAFNEIATRSSFPSGHTAMAFGVAMLLTLWAYGTGERWKGHVVLVMGFLLAGLCGLARIYGALHYPLDVVAGALAGVGGPLAVHGVMRLWRRSQAPGAPAPTLDEEG